MKLLKELRRLKRTGQLADDGSLEAAASYEALVIEAEDMAMLMENESFQKILGSLRGKLRDKMELLVSKDPELKAIKDTLTRIVGIRESTNQIEESLKDFIGE